MIIFNIGITGQCDTVEDLQELEQKVLDLIAGLPPTTIVTNSGMTGQVNTVLTKPKEAEPVLKLRSKDNGIIRDTEQPIS